jgi:shikimate kinase
VDLDLIEFSLPRVTGEFLVLIGPPGAGKTTIGLVLAKRLGFQFLDTDHLIEEATGHSPAEIFSDYGESAFRWLEAKVVDELLKSKLAVERIVDRSSLKLAGRRLDAGVDAGIVLSTGAGLSVQPGLYEKLERLGATIGLTAPIEVLAERIGSFESRPMLAAAGSGCDQSQKKEEDRGQDDSTGLESLEKLRGLLLTRGPVYARAQLTVDTNSGDVEAVVEALVQLLESRSGAESVLE